VPYVAVDVCVCCSALQCVAVSIVVPYAICLRQRHSFFVMYVGRS